MLQYHPKRHDLVWLERSALPACKLSGGQPIEIGRAFELLADWVHQGNPLIVARQPSSQDSLSHLRVGLALPPALGKWRLAFDVPFSGLRASSNPPALVGLIREMPLHWHGPLQELASLSDIAACQPLLYGSAGMQALTGLQCLSDSSDIDLLFHPRQAEDYLRLLVALKGWSDQYLHLRIDGEIVNANGWASAWRDCASQADQVLCKSIHDVALLPRDQFEVWPEACEVEA